MEQGSNRYQSVFRLCNYAAFVTPEKYGEYEFTT